MGLERYSCSGALKGSFLEGFGVVGWRSARVEGRGMERSVLYTPFTKGLYNNQDVIDTKI